MSGTTKISINGDGVMFCVYKLDQGQFDKFLESNEEGDLDCDDLEQGMDYGEQMGPYWNEYQAPSIYLNDEYAISLGTDDGSDNADGFKDVTLTKGSTSASNITQRGEWWAVSVEHYRGSWGEIEIDGEFDIQKLSLSITDFCYGNESTEKHEIVEIASSEYDENQHGEFDNHSLEGKSIDWYLIDAEGNAHPVY